MKVVTPEGYTFVTKFQEDNSHKVLRSVDFFSIKFDEIFFDTVCWVDLSAAFDTVDHHILLKRMRHLYGIDDTAWCWFESYLDNRHTNVSNQRFIILSPCLGVWRTTGICIGCKIIFHVHLPNIEYHQKTWRPLSLLR